METNVYLIRLELTPDEGHALESLAEKELRLAHAQARYIIHQQLFILGLLPNAETLPILQTQPR